MSFAILVSCVVKLCPVMGSVLILVNYVFCDKFCVCNDKYVFIVVKIKCVNSDNMSDSCDKLKFTTNYTTFTITDTQFIKPHTFYNF